MLFEFCVRRLFIVIMICVCQEIKLCLQGIGKINMTLFYYLDVFHLYLQFNLIHYNIYVTASIENMKYFIFVMKNLANCKGTN